MRTFIAIELPDSVKNELIAFEDELSTLGFECKFTNFDNLHITLMFLGECKEVETKILMDILETKINKSSFEISINKMGMFKNGKIPKILFADINEGSKELTELNRIAYEHSKHILARNKLENNFKPHITIGRVGEIEWKMIPQLERKLNEMKPEIKFTAKEVVIFESILEKSGPRYKKLRGIELT